MSSGSLTVVAGPNGSGKSTLIEQLLRQGIELGEYINADDIVKQRRLLGDEGAREGQLLADAARDRCLRDGRDFSFETVMSHVSKVDFMSRAKSLGFHVTLFFVATSDPTLNVERVSSRVLQGGHDVPTDRIIARYQRTLALLPQALAACSNATIFDNSRNAALGVGGLRPVARLENFERELRLEFYPPVPLWAIAALDFSNTIWCFQRILIDSNGSVSAWLIRKENAEIDTSIGQGAPVTQLKAALEEASPPSEIRLHHYRR